MVKKERENSGKMEMTAAGSFWDIPKYPCKNRVTRLQNQNPQTTFTTKLGDRCLYDPLNTSGWDKPSRGKTCISPASVQEKNSRMYRMDLRAEAS